MSFAVQKTVSELAEEFLSQQAQEDRKHTINKINNSFKLNPYHVLDVAHTATMSEINKQFRSLSLLVHPDKIHNDELLRNQAQLAFNAINKAKSELTDEAKSKEFQRVIDEVKPKTILKLEKSKKLKLAGDITAAAISGDLESKEFEEALRSDIKEYIIDIEWQKKQQLKQKAEAEKRRQLKEEAESKKQLAAQEEKKQWEDNTENRVNSWRNFQSKVQNTKKRGVGMIGMSGGAQLKSQQEPLNKSSIPAANSRAHSNRASVANSTSNAAHH
jgi:DnaJ family protein C protein 8